MAGRLAFPFVRYSARRNTGQAFSRSGRAKSAAKAGADYVRG